jgi:GntR family transcriptional regulator
VARRYHFHPNTVSAGYRQLQRDRWVEFRRGSGVYVRDTKPEPSSSLAPDQLIANLLKSARELNVPLSEVCAEYASGWTYSRLITSC